jgi:hypothetical protein
VVDWLTSALIVSTAMRVVKVSPHLGILARRLT